MNIFVGNLSFDATQDDVKKLFEGFGNVASVAIVRRKEKKTPKSRGFGFVEMPDEQQALAAIAALNGKEFMDRILNVDPARPKGQKAMVWLPLAKAKKEAQAASELKEKRQPKPGAYRGGRRTHSYMKRRGLAGMQEEAKPRQRSQDNPMRWRKRQDQPKPWQRSSDEHKPWKKTEEGARPWSKSSGESKPWKKPSGGPKPWSKSSERPQKSRFNPSTSLGMVRGNGGRSRTKGRKIPGGYKR